MWFGYTYGQGAGHQRVAFRVKVADNTIKAPVCQLRVDICGSELPNTWHTRDLRGTDFTAPNTYQEFTMELDKGEQGFGDYAIGTYGKTVVTFDGITVTQTSAFSTDELLKLIHPPVKPQGLALQSDPFRVHETHGLYAELWGVQPAVALLAAGETPGASWSESYVTVHSQRTAVDGFPMKWEAMYQQRVIVLNNTPPKCVTIIGALMLKEYVRDGGCLVLMGDTHEFGAEGWQSSVLADLLPCAINPAQPLTHAKTPLAITPCSEALKTGIDWRTKPVTLYYHQATVKPGAVVLLAAGTIPLAVEQRVGKGRIVVLLTSVCGEMSEKAPGVPFWLWRDWPMVMSRLLHGVATP